MLSHGPSHRSDRSKNLLYHPISYPNSEPERRFQNCIDFDPAASSSSVGFADAKKQQHKKPNKKGKKAAAAKPTPAPSPVQSPAPGNYTTANAIANGLPGGSAYICLGNVTSAAGQGCSDGDTNAMKLFMATNIGVDTAAPQCIEVYYGVCMQFDFLDIPQVGGTGLKGGGAGAWD